MLHQLICEVNLYFKVQINVQVQINVRAGQLVKINKRTGPNKHTGWKSWEKIMIHLLENLVKHSYFMKKT